MKREVLKSLKRIAALMLAFIMSFSLFGPSVKASAATTVVTLYRVVEQYDNTFKIFDESGNDLTGVDVTSSIVEKTGENVSVVSYDGTAENPEDNIYSLKTPVKSGFTFNGWYMDPVASTKINAIQASFSAGENSPVDDRYYVEGIKPGEGLSLSDRLTALCPYVGPRGDTHGFCLYAKWTYSPSSGTTYITQTEKEYIYVSADVYVYIYNVSLVSEYGNGQIDNYAIKDGEEFVLPECGFKAPEGKRFINWEIDGKSYKPGDKIIVDKNKTVKAVWGSAYIMQGEPQWEWENVSAEALASSDLIPKASVKIKVVSTNDTSDVKTYTYSGDKIAVSKDTNASQDGLVAVYNAKIVGDIDVFYKDLNAKEPINASEISSTKTYQLDVRYAPKVKWIDKWPVVLNKASGNPTMRYTISYKSKLTGKTFTTDPCTATVSSDLASSGSKATNATFTATADLTGFYKKIDGAAFAENVVNKCSYIYPNGEDEGITGTFTLKNCKFGWKLASCVPVQFATHDASGNATYVLSGDAAYDEKIQYLTPNVSAEASYTVFKDGERLEDVVINVPVTIESEPNVDGTVIKYTASVSTFDGLIRKESKCISVDPRSDSFGKVLTGIVIEGVKKEYAYTGAAIKPDFRVINYDEGGRVMTEKKPVSEYSVKYSDNTNISATNKNRLAKITVKIKTGKHVNEMYYKEFEIVNELETDNSVPVIDAVKKIKIEPKVNYVYDGEAHYPERIIITKLDKTEMIMLYDGEGGYYASGDGRAYVSVSNNINVGTASVLVWGADGKAKKANFKIVKAVIDDNALNKDLKYEFVNGDTYYCVKGGVKPSLIVKYKDTELIEGKDYQLGYSKNKKVGTGEITIKNVSKNNYNFKLKTKIPFNIVKYDISYIDVDKVSIDTINSAIKPSAVKISNVLTEDGEMIDTSQLTVSVYKDGQLVDKKSKLTAGSVVTLRVEPKNGEKNMFYTGSFDIEGVSIGIKFNPKIKYDTLFKKSSFIYNGEPVILDELLDGEGLNPYENGRITLTQNVNKVTRTLVYGVDYEIQKYEDNTLPGKIKIYFKGIGEFSGTKMDKTLQIKSK